MAPLGVLLVTGGRTHQENYAADFAADPRCRLIGLADERDVPPDRARWNRELAAELGIPVLELDRALARSDVHVASVCAEPERRGRLGALCARAGKHVYMDKPIAGSLAHAEELVRAVSEAGVRSQMFSMVRRGWAKRTRDVVRSGSIGGLAGIHCDLLFAKGPAGTAPPARRRERYPPRRFTFVDSKRELFTTGVYSIGLIRWLTGLEVRRVHAVTANYFFAEHAANDVEDFAAALLELDGGVIASITAGRIGWTSHPGAGPMRFYLAGSRGSAIVDAYRPRLEVSDSRPPWTPPQRFAEDPMGFWSSTQKLSGVTPKRVWRPFETGTAPDSGDESDAGHFLDCIEAGRESDMNVGEARRILEALFACYRSAAEGRPVEVR